MSKRPPSERPEGVTFPRRRRGAMAGSMARNRTFRWVTFAYVGIGVLFVGLLVASAITSLINRF